MLRELMLPGLFDPNVLLLLSPKSLLSRFHLSIGLTLRLNEGLRTWSMNVACQDREVEVKLKPREG